MSGHPGLSALNAAFEAAESKEGGFVEVPDGQYQARIDSAEYEEREGGRHRIMWRMTVLNGQQAGAGVYKFSGITENSMSFLKRDLALLDIMPLTLDMLPNALAGAAGKIVQITKTQGRPNAEGRTFSNINFDSVVQSPDPVTGTSDSPFDEGTTTSGPVPF